MALSFLGQDYGERDHWKRPEVGLGYIAKQSVRRSNPVIVWKIEFVFGSNG